MIRCDSVITFIVVIWIVPSTALQCLECFGAKDDQECNVIGKIRTCRFNQDACEIELREHGGWGGHILMYKQCKQSKACDNNHIQNPKSAWMPSQCNPDNFNSVCRCCCYEDLCNVARDTCFASPGGCTTPPSRVHRGSVSCTNGREFGSECKVSCNPGAMLVGTPTTQCRYDGSWSFRFAQCQDIFCPQKSILINGWYSCTNSQFAGSECAAQCRPGYTLVGQKISRCMNTGVWSSYDARCEGLQCSERKNVVGGVIVCSDERYLQSRCRVECDGFRKLVGIYESYCQDNGEWSHDLPTCELIQCPIRGTIIHGGVSCTIDVEVNSMCTATCDVGYTPDGPISSICLPTGNWDSPLPRCTRIQCPSRGAVVGAEVSCTDTVFVGSICTVECNSGSRIRGNDISECLPNGKWNSPLPVCERVVCPELGMVVGGVVSCSYKRFQDSVCTAKCKMGSRLVGKPSTTCLPSGAWSDPLPKCTRIVCSAISFDEGFMTCTDDFFYASSCSFRCPNGFRMRGSPRLRCQLTGLWSTRLPTCNEIICPPRGNVANGLVTCSAANNVESVCTVTCNEGFSLVGTAASVCTDTGRWDSKLPVCRPIICALRGLVSGGSVTCTNDNLYKSVCTATCNFGTELVGIATSSCLATGLWDEPLATCRRLPCPDQGDLEHGTITCTDDWNIASVCTFKCEGEGYELYPRGRTKNVCQPRQRWNLPKPCCSRPCPPYAVMDIVLVLDSSSSIGSENWISLTNFVRGIIRSFIVAPDAANFAIFRYNKRVDQDTQIFLNMYPGDVDGLIDAFGEIPYNGSGTFTGRGLEHALTVSLATENGNRPDIKDVVFVITDGKAADDVKTPSDALRASGATVLVLGIEPPKGALDKDQLRDISGGDDNLVIAEGGFDGLDKAFGIKLSRTICGEPCK